MIFVYFLMPERKAGDGFKEDYTSVKNESNKTWWMEDLPVGEQLMHYSVQ